MRMTVITRRRFGAIYLATASLIVGVVSITTGWSGETTTVGNITFFAGQKVGFPIIILGGIISVAMWGKNKTSADKILSELNRA
jgi:uncharacterized membrane protein YphA (DoxX/SURF4 family)